MLEKQMDVSSALKYNFDKKPKEIFYFDLNVNEINRNKYGTKLYLDNNNYPFAPGTYHKIDCGDGTTNHIKVLDMGLSVNEGTLRYHNRIAKIIFHKYIKLV